MSLRPFLPPDTGGISYPFGRGRKAAGAVDAADAGHRAAGG